MYYIFNILLLLFNDIDYKEVCRKFQSYSIIARSVWQFLYFFCPQYFPKPIYVYELL